MEKNPDNSKKPKKKKFCSLVKKFNAAVKDLRWKDVKEMSAETAKDLKKGKEVGKLLAAVIIPGGFIAYPIYRMKKHHDIKKGANDNEEKKPKKKPKPPTP